MRNATELLRKLVSIPSFSGEEHPRSDFLSAYFTERGVHVERIGNNLVVRHPRRDASKPTLMLNSHLDTVRPNTGYTFDPFHPPVSETRVNGVGSNDAGASVVAMIQTFSIFMKKNFLSISCWHSPPRRRTPVPTVCACYGKALQRGGYGHHRRTDRYEGRDREGLLVIDGRRQG